MASYRFCIGLASALAASFFSFAFAFVEPFARAIDYGLRIAFDPRPTVDHLRLALDAELVTRAPERYRARSFVTRILQRASTERHASPLAAGSGSGLCLA